MGCCLPALGAGPVELVRQGGIVFRKSGGRFAIPLLRQCTDSHRETLPSLTPIVAGAESARSRAGAAEPQVLVAGFRTGCRRSGNADRAKASPLLYGDLNDIRVSGFILNGAPKLHQSE
jgi:hypothetical protein